MLVLTRKTGQRIQIGDSITITILRVRGQAVRVGIEAPDDVRILRSELRDGDLGVAADEAVEPRAAANPASFGEATSTTTHAAHERPLGANRLGAERMNPERLGNERIGPDACLEPAPASQRQTAPLARMLHRNWRTAPEMPARVGDGGERPAPRAIRPK